jgi:formamidopyrimidine-DNA glycosylase
VPELPEVEVVRRGLSPYVCGHVIDSVSVEHARSVRRHLGGPRAFCHEVGGALIRHVSRRGKYLWFVLASGSQDRALVAHLGMSGQLLLIDPADVPGQVRLTHVRVRFDLNRPRQLWFVDQRTFGGLFVDELVDDGAGGVIPASIAHIARDPLDPLFDEGHFIAALRRRSGGIKRAILDQSLVSGIGNIYADEALWRSAIHFDRPCSQITSRAASGLLSNVRDVMVEALAEGGTSFDDLYVNVNGESGYFERALRAYGREGQPCDRCGRLIVREPFMNRSSFRCPHCQRRPRAARSSP